MTLFLARIFGARKARVVGQLLSALIGASLFFVLQSPNFLPDDVRARLMPRILELLNSGWLAGDSPLWWPVRALFGEPLPLAATVAVGAGLFVVVVRLTGRAFASGTQESTTRPSRGDSSSGAATFLHGLRRTVMRKEWRLIVRDPNLIAKTLLQALYLLPLLFIMLRNAELLDVLAPGIIVLLAGVAGNLAWITISGEESPDLIGRAPVDREQVRWFKAAAALRPIAWAAVPFIGFYLLYAPWLAVVFVAYLTLALVGAAVTQVWGGKPAPKRDLKQRQKQNIGLNFVELISTVSLAAACYLTFNPSWWAFALAPVGLLAPGLAWTMRRRDAI
jgi:ABC-2 type transport system permease protein